MTGVGTASGATEIGHWTVELRSVNGRGVSVRFRLDTTLHGLEADLERRLRARVQRGTFTVAVARDPESGSTDGVATESVIDAAAAARVHRELADLHQRLGLAGDGPTLREVLAVPGVILGSARVRAARVAPAQAAALFERALDELLVDREREGAALVRALASALDELARLRERAAARAPERVADYRAKLLARVREFLAERAKVMADDDVIREVALFADRADVTEELERLDVHIEHARQLLRGAAAGVGRRLEFLLQEALREANTLGSKSADVEMTELAVAMKDAIDKMKEQAANLE